MLSVKLPVKCPLCSRNSTLKDWDDLSLSKCTSREMRRAYTHLYEKKAFNIKSEVFFQCPVCLSWSQGSELAIDSEDAELKKLGRKPRTLVPEDNKHIGGKKHG